MNYEHFLDQLSQLLHKGWIPSIESRQKDGRDGPDVSGSIYLRKPKYTIFQAHNPLDALATDISGRTHSCWHPYNSQKTLGFDDPRIDINHLIWAETRFENDSNRKYKDGQISQSQMRADLVMALELENYPTEEDVREFYDKYYPPLIKKVFRFFVEV